MTDTNTENLPVSGVYTRQGKKILDEHELLAFVNWVKDMSNPRRATLIRYVCEGLVRDAEKKEMAKPVAPPVAPTKEHLIKLLLSDDTPSVHLDCEIAEYFGYSILPIIDDGVTDIRIVASSHTGLASSLGPDSVPLPRFTANSKHAILWWMFRGDSNVLDLKTADYMQDYIIRETPISPSVHARCYTAALLYLYKF
jgi:hypothetical protein